MPSQKRTASQAHLTMPNAKMPRNSTTLQDSEPRANAGPTTSSELKAKWHALLKESLKHYFPAMFTGDSQLPVHNPQPLRAPPPSQPQANAIEAPSSPPRRSQMLRNHSVPTNLMASSSSSTSCNPLPPPPSSSATTTSFSHLSLTPTATPRTSVVNSCNSTFPVEIPSLDAIQRSIARSRIWDGPMNGVNKPHKPRKRRHIYDRLHKKHVEEELTMKLYEMQRKKGYQSDYETFKDYLRYRNKLEEQRKLDSVHTRAKSRTPSNLPIITPADESFFTSVMEKARRSLESPKPPPPFNPSLEQLRLMQKARDEIIQNRLHPKRQPLPAYLPDDAQKEVNALLKKRGVISKAGKEQVSDRDIVKLGPSEWLNDEIINFYGQLIVNRSLEAEATKENKANGKKKVLDVHYFSTFFWPKLMNGYEKGRLGKWTKKMDLFAKDIILIPVNHNNTHWTAAAINFRRKRIESYDSMGMYRGNVYKALRQYLDDEHKNKKKKPFDFTGWEDYVMENAPQQENGFDCGVFTCQTLEALSRGEEEFNFTQRNMPYLRQKMIWEIGRAKLADTS